MMPPLLAQLHAAKAKVHADPGVSGEPRHQKVQWQLTLRSVQKGSTVLLSHNCKQFAVST